MKLTIFVQGEGQVALTDRNYVSSGGEANIYKKGRTAYKIYHDPKKMISQKKMTELSHLTSDNVLTPKQVIHDKNNKLIGYTMPFQNDTHPLCKLFTKSFKNSNGVSENDIIELVTKIQKTVVQIHKDGCLVVDMNEMNILVSSDCTTPFFIDVDSYQTPSCKATAIMESIRDRLVKNNNFTELSDWFSFAVLAFQLYIGIHPYKGNHPNYKLNEWSKRMGDGISVFDKKVTLPKVCNPLSVIPDSHLQWFKTIFGTNSRSIPPFVDDKFVLIIAPTMFIEGTGDFTVTLFAEYDENILGAYNFMGVDYAVTDKHVYKGTATCPVDVLGYKTVLCEASNMIPIIGKLKGGMLDFNTLSGESLGNVAAVDIMYKNGAIYSLNDGKIFEHRFEQFSGKIIHQNRVACNALENATKFFDGVIMQDLIGQWYITLPYERGKCFFHPIKELEGYRILEARAEGNLCGLMAEKKGVYDRFLLTFDDKFKTYKTEKEEDVAYGPINFTVLPNGVCIMVADSEVRLFKGDKGKKISDPPFDVSTRLYNVSGNVRFIDKNKAYTVKMSS